MDVPPEGSVAFRVKTVCVSLRVQVLGNAWFHRLRVQAYLCVQRMVQHQHGKNRSSLITIPISYWLDPRDRADR